MILKSQEDREAAEQKRQELAPLVAHAQQQAAIWANRAERVSGALELLDEQLAEEPQEEPIAEEPKEGE